jgi:unsaturated rhamnogalacturonyl hydrolase
MTDSILSGYGPSAMRWHYEEGLLLMAVLKVAQLEGDGQLADRVRASYDALVSPDGCIATYRQAEYNLDQINPGKVLFELFDRTGDARYRLAIERLMAQLRAQPRTKSGGFWHKQIYPWQIWLDGLYMAGPFYARYVAESGDPQDFEDIVSQFLVIAQKAYDPRTGLLYHAWDESRQQLWADPATGCSPHFWGRAMGWYCMALVDVLDYLPQGHPGREGLIAIIERCARAVLAFQDKESGLWHQVMDQGGRPGNYLESSASSMFIYFLHKAQRKGYVAFPDLDIPNLVEAAYAALVARQVREDASGLLHLGGICSVAGLGGKPYRDGSYHYYVRERVVEDDFKGVGAFILASLELGENFA